MIFDGVTVIYVIKVVALDQSKPVFILFINAIGKVVCLKFTHIFMVAPSNHIVAIATNDNISRKNLVWLSTISPLQVALIHLPSFIFC